MRRLGEVLLALEEVLVNPLACCFSSIALRRLPVGATVRMSITGQVLDVQLEKLRQSFKEKRSGVDAGRAASWAQVPYFAVRPAPHGKWPARNSQINENWTAQLEQPDQHCDDPALGRRG